MQTSPMIVNGTVHTPPMLERELYRGELYEYYPLGQHVVAAPGVCGGRPTFKYTRIEVGVIFGWLANGCTIDGIVQDFNRPHLTREAIGEALALANQALVEKTGAQTRQAA